MLDDVQAIRPYLFDDFQRIPDTVTRLERAQRLLELLPRYKHRSARIQRSHTASIGVLTSQRDPLLIERLNPNNRNTTPLGKANNIVLARRNSEPQRLIQEQARRRVATNSSTVRYNYTKGYGYGKYACLAAKQAYTPRCKYKGEIYTNRFGTLVQRLAIAILRATLRATPIPIPIVRATAAPTASILGTITNQQLAQLLEQ